MGLYFLLAILGIGAIGSAFGLFDGDNDDEDPDEVDRSGNDRLTVQSDETVDAGAGNDTITASGDSQGLVDGAVVWGREGDDTITLGSVEGKQVVHGGVGDDTITGGGGTDTELYGGKGEDVIRYSGNAGAYGGGGDDDISMLSGGAVHGSTAEGGGGDDTLTVFGGVDQNQYRGPTGLRGGAGDDEFNIEIQSVADPITDPDDPALGYVKIFGVIRDFNPLEDRLVIDLTDLDNDTLTMTNLSLVMTCPPVVPQS